MGSSIMRKAGEMASANAIWARRCLPADSSGIGLVHREGWRTPLPASPIPFSQMVLVNPGSPCRGSLGNAKPKPANADDFSHPPKRYSLTQKGTYQIRRLSGAGDGIPSATPWHSGPISIPGPTLKPTTREQPCGRLQDIKTSDLITNACV